MSLIAIDITARALIGMGALLAGVGSVLSGIAALHTARHETSKKETPKQETPEPETLKAVENEAS